METNGIRYYEFGEFRLDTRQRILIQNENRISLTAKMFDLLLFLVQNEGQVLEHDELLDKIWEGTFVEQANLKKSVSMLRHILGEKPNESRYIKTIPRRGYAFVAEVKPLNNEETAIYREVEKEIFIEEIIETDELPTKSESQKLLTSSKSETFFSKNKWKISLAAFAVLAICGGFIVSKVITGKPSVNFSIENVRAKRLTTEGKLGNLTMVSPDGNNILYSLYDGETAGLWIRQIASGNARQLTAPSVSSFWAYTFSPDGNYVFYIIHDKVEPSKSGLFKVSSFGGLSNKLQDSASAGLTVSPDGTRLAYSRLSDDPLKKEIVSITADGTDLKKIFIIPDNKFLMSMRWSPDGKSLLCSFRETVEEKFLNYVAEVSIEGNDGKLVETIIFPRQANAITSAVWLPDKTSMLLNIREKNADICQIWQYFPSTGEKKRVTNDNASYRASSVSADGKTLTATQETDLNGIWISDTEKINFASITSQTLHLLEAIWTNDNRLIYEITDNGEEVLAIMNADGSENLKITDGKDGVYLNPRISKDGKSVVFSSSRNSGTDQIWKVSFDGKELTQLVNNPQMEMSEAELLADGQTVVYRGYLTASGWNLYKQTADGKTVKLTETDPTDWQISDDEKLIFFTMRDEKTKKYRTHIANFETGEILKTFDIQGWQIEWTHDGKGLVYLKSSKDASEIFVQNLDGSAPKLLFNLRGEQIRYFNFSKDDKKIAATRGKAIADAVLIKAE